MCLICRPIKILKISGTLTSWKIWTWSASDFFLSILLLILAYYRKWGDCLLKKDYLHLILSPLCSQVSFFTFCFIVFSQNVILAFVCWIWSTTLLEAFAAPLRWGPAPTPALHFCCNKPAEVSGFSDSVSMYSIHFNNCCLRGLSTAYSGMYLKLGTQSFGVECMSVHCSNFFPHARTFTPSKCFYFCKLVSYSCTLQQPKLSVSTLCIVKGVRRLCCFCCSIPLCC